MILSHYDQVARLVQPAGDFAARAAIMRRADNAGWEMVPTAEIDVSGYGVSPSATPDENRGGVAAAIAALPADGGTIVFRTPGAYLFSATTNPYEAGYKCCIDINRSNVRLLLEAGVTLNIADGQQTDAGGPVHFIVWQNRSNIAIVGAGPGQSFILGNTAGQPGWTTTVNGYKYAQASTYGSLIRSYGSNQLRTDNKDIYIAGLTLGDCWSNPVDLWYVTRVRVENCHAYDYGEGFEVVGCTDAVFDHLSVDDSSQLSVGDHFEFSDVNRGRLNGLTGVSGIIPLQNKGGSWVDLFKSDLIEVTNCAFDGGSNLFNANTNTSSNKARTLAFRNIVCRNLWSGGLWLPTDIDEVTLQGITLEDCAGDGILVDRAAADVPLSMEGIHIINGGGNGIVVSGSSRVAIKNSFIRNCVKSGILIQRQAAAQAPSVTIVATGCRNNGRYGVELDGAGDATYAPTVRLYGSAELENNTLGTVAATNGALTTNLLDVDAALTLLTKLKTVDGVGSGLDADTVRGLIARPRTDQQYVAEYRPVSTGIWQTSDNGGFVATGGSITGISASATLPAMQTIATAATINSDVGYNASAFQVAAGLGPEIEFYLRLDQITNVRFFIGYSNGTGTGMVAADNIVAAYCGIRFSTSAGDTKFTAISSSNSTPTTLDLGIAPVAGTLYKLRVRINSGDGSQSYFIDGILKGTITGPAMNVGQAYRTTIGLRNLEALSKSFTWVAGYSKHGPN